MIFTMKIYLKCYYKYEWQIVVIVKFIENDFLLKYIENHFYSENDWKWFYNEILLEMILR